LATIAILPARSGSKRIKNKNIIDFCGKPIIAYALEAASKSQLFDKIHVSTDSTKIKKVVESLGYPVEFMRPPELAGDIVGTIPVLQWVLEKYNTLNKNYDDVFSIMPTAPFLKPDDLIKAYELYLKHNRKHPLHIVSEFPVPVEWAYRRDAEGLLDPVQPGAYAIRSQDLEKAYYETGPFSIFNTSHIISSDPVTDEGFISYVMPRDRAIDIDNYQDLKFAEKIFLGQQSLEKDKS
jgi:N-acylneuraminate cytidylyltransferase